MQRALQVRTKSLGSAIGTLRSVSLHGRNRAGLWLDRTGQRVNVKFENEHIPGVRELLGRRVMIKGELDRNSSGQLLAIKFKRADVLPTRDESPRLSSYTGICPDITDGRSIPEHLEIIRGAS
nr:Unknown Function [uncultured bacterium]